MSEQAWSRRRVDCGPDGPGFTLLTRSGPRPGPTVAVIGGIHGDEWEGMLIAGALVADPPALTCGELRLVAIANEAAFAAGTRACPGDGADLARTFPGNPRGPVSERLSAALDREVLAGVDLLIDLHSAGSRYAMPLLVGCLDAGPVAERGLAAARAFGAPFLWRHDRYAAGRTVSVVAERGGVALYVECAGGPTADERVIGEFADGVRRVLAQLGMVNGAPPAPDAPPRELSGGGDLDRDVVRADRDGFFFAAVSAGDVVEEGGLVGVVRDVTGAELERVTAPGRRCVALLRRTCGVRAGDVLVAFAEID